MGLRGLCLCIEAIWVRGARMDGRAGSAAAQVGQESELAGVMTDQSVWQIVMRKEQGMVLTSR